MKNMQNVHKFIVKPLLRSQIRLYVFLGVVLGVNKLILWINNQVSIMFRLGIIKGTIIGMSTAIVTGLALKELSKMKKKKDKVSEIENDIPDTQDN